MNFTPRATRTKLNIGVFFGGQSIECEVSFNSGRTVCDHLDTQRFNVIPLFQSLQGMLYILPAHFLHRGKISDFEHRLPSEAQSVVWDDLPTLIDFAFIAMHGRYAEDGALQGMFELLKIPYFGAKVFASALGMDKIMQKKWLIQAGIRVPGDVSMADPVYPCVVKPAHEGSSLGISIAHNHEQLRKAVALAAHITPGKVQPVVVEEQVAGMEFSCIIITHSETGEPLPLPPTEIVPEKDADLFDYEQKYMPGRGIKYTPARCTAEQIVLIQKSCVAAMQALYITEFARVDGFLTPDGTIVIIDVNTLGGMSPAAFTFLQAAEVGLSHTGLINHFLHTSLQAAGIISPSVGQDMNIPSQARKRVAVLLGGASAERETSLDSGRNVVYKLSPQKYEVVPIFVDHHMHLYRIDQKQLIKNSTHEIQLLLREEQRVQWSDMPSLADFVFIALHGGQGENGCVQGALELLRMPYNGSSIAASALCMDKYATGRFLKSQGFDVPQQLLIERAVWESHIDALAFVRAIEIALPVIVKPYDDGCSVLVQRASTIPELVDAINLLFAENRSHALIEEYVVGMELTVGVLGNDEPQVLPPSYTVAAGGILSIKEKFLPGAGENQTPAPLPAKAISLVQETIGHVYRALGCRGYARLDCFYQSAEQSPTGRERVVILECNSLPGLTPATCIFHQAAEVGIKPMDFIDSIIEYGFAEHQGCNNFTREIMSRAPNMP